jgi:DNA-binding phage protein
MTMPLTVAFKETVMARLARDPSFAAAMLQEGINALLDDEFEIGKEMLRDYINATMGFGNLAKKLGIPAKSLMRMLGPNGNPQASNLLSIVGALQRYAGVEFRVTGELADKAARLERAERARIQGRREGDSKGKMAIYRERSYEARMAFEETAAKFKRR